MWFLQILTYAAFLGFVGGIVDAALEGTHWAFKNPEPHWLIFLSGFWLLIAVIFDRTHRSKQNFLAVSAVPIA
jgi:hypothetical protein